MRGTIPSNILPRGRPLICPVGADDGFSLDIEGNFYLWRWKDERTGPIVVGFAFLLPALSEAARMTYWIYFILVRLDDSGGREG